MKKILVIDESEVIRETLALILGREFDVVHRPPGEEGLALSNNEKDAGLLILGISPLVGTDVSGLLEFSSQMPCAVLFLIDSNAVVSTTEAREKVGFLAKPFNPYELKAEVKRLLTPRTFFSRPPKLVSDSKTSEIGRYLDFPYLSRSAAALARKFSASRLPLLIYGETGCGQERVAQAIHALEREAGPCISLNCAAIGETDLAVNERQFSVYRSGADCRLTIMIEGLDRLLPGPQASLSTFLDDLESKAGNLRLLATARTDLLEKVYQGQFLESLYYRLAILVLRLMPLRDRAEEVPAVATWFAQRYGERLGVGAVSFSAATVERLSKYLWFGNIYELEAVIARTLAVHGKSRIEVTDLCLESAEENPLAETSGSDLMRVSEARASTFPEVTKSPAQSEASPSVDKGAANGKSPDLKLLIHELAHELKNPMVTIKTFAQLLGERYQDEAFRARFQDIVDGDIERIDDLLEVMIEFANFSQPSPGKVPLQNLVQSILEDIASECAKRQAQIRWNEKQTSGEILTDERQLQFVLKNALLAVVSQAKSGTEIEIDITRQGALNISYMRQGGRISPITYLFDLSSGNGEEGILPLRILLAKQLVERNGGKMVVEHLEGEKDILRMEFPIA